VLSVSLCLLVAELMLYLLYSPSTQFVGGMNIPYVFRTTCFGLMGPFSGMFSFFVQSPFCYATLPTLGVRGMYVLSFCPLSNVLFIGSIKC
jgi:hypothetical protein